MIVDRPIQESCVICKESHPATKFCLDCNEVFCDDIAIIHSRQRISSNHIILPIEQYNQHKNTRRHLEFLHHRTCIQHNRPFEFLDLETKTHNKLLCSDCLSDNHNSLVGLDDCTSSFLEMKLEHIRDLGSQGIDHLAELQEEEESLSSRLKDLEDSQDRTLSEIRRVFLSLHEALQTRQSELEREVEELSKSACFQLADERERSRVWQGQLLLLEKCVEEINQNPPPLPPPKTSTPSPTEFLSPKALMVNVCLLENALGSSLSSSRASSSLTDVQSQLRVSKIRDQIEFQFEFLLSESPLTPPSSSSISCSVSRSSEEKEELEVLFHRISSMFSVTSTSSCPFRSDWSENKVQSVMTFYSEGNGANQLSAPNGMTYSPDSKLFYVCDSGNNRIQVFRNHEGRVGIEYLPPLGSSGDASSDSGLALIPPYTAPPLEHSPVDICYHDGQLFIVDCDNHRVQVWREEDGSFLRMIGTGSAGNAVGQFSYPWGCTVYQNHLFVSEYRNHRIQKFSLSDFSVIKVIGSKGSGLGQLCNPKKLSIFNDKLYVADSDNNRISVFDLESGAALSVIGPSLPTDLSQPVVRLQCSSHLSLRFRSQLSVFLRISSEWF